MTNYRRLGEWLCLLALLHTAGMMTVWYTLLRPLGWTLGYFFTRKVILLGLIAFICYELLYATSLACVRRRMYEFFIATHVILQFVALALVWFHHPRSRAYVGTALAVVLLDRLFPTTGMQDTQILRLFQNDRPSAVLAAASSDCAIVYRHSQHR